jgi:hypothetical protein
VQAAAPKISARASLLSIPRLFPPISAPMIRRDRARAHPRPGQLVMAVFLNLMIWVAAGYAGFAGFQGYLHRAYGSGHTLIQEAWGLRLAVALGVVILFSVLAFLHGVSTKCPLCHGTPFHAKRCHMNQAAVRFPLIGYRASAVLCLITMGRFVCMYCGTPFRWRK